MVLRGKHRLKPVFCRFIRARASWGLGCKGTLFACKVSLQASKTPVPGCPKLRQGGKTVFQPVAAVRLTGVMAG
jgi:hypothetical protein